MNLRFAVLSLILTASPVVAQWELGALGGYGFRRDLTVSGPAGQATVGFRPGTVWGFAGGLNEYGYLAGEARYLYEDGEIRLRSGGTETRFASRAHLVHFDFLVHSARSGSRVRPFLVIGGGVKVYEGTGPDRAVQPLSRFVGLTRTRDTKPLMTPGGGVKFQVSRHVSLRGEFRDYITPRPEKVLAPAAGVTMKGWVHDFVPMIGVMGTF
ncbi:MAG TPA: hypothetical protein VFL57_18600 [Bryobacteraceae bacterium]|nr:hypothetical protein [Bryobacteraceae bacterium]